MEGFLNSFRKGEDTVGAAVRGAPRQWPLFSAPVISSLRIVNVKEKGGTLYFTVRSILEGFKWKIDKTYDDFVEIQKVLVSNYGMDHPTLPGYRKLFGLSLFMGVKENQAAEMRDKLEAFLIKAVTHFPIPPTELLLFVEYPFTDVLSVTQALAKFFYAQGDMVLTNKKAVLMSPLQLHCVNKRMTLPLGSSETGKMKDDFGHLLDFMQNLQKLKISPPTEEHAMIADIDHLTFELSLMKSVEVLLIESIHIHQLETRHTLPSQLVKLEVRRSLKLLQDILLVYAPSEVDQSPVSPSLPSLLLSAQEVDLSRALKWTKLQQANFKLNGIKAIDQSVKLLVVVEVLDLSFNYIEEIQHLVDLPHLRVLDLGHNKISDLRDLNTKLGNITKLSLASNNIVRLNGIEKMFSISYLDLSNNHISDVSEVGCLKSLPCLTELLLKGNPIAHSLSYRSQVFTQLATIANQVALDGKHPSKDELVVSMGTPQTTGHKRVPSRTRDIEPDEHDVDKEEATPLEDLEAGLGFSSHLEELRKDGGDKWLSILNSTSAKAEDSDSVVVAKSPKGAKKKKGKHHKDKDHKKKANLEHSQEEAPLSAVSTIADPTEDLTLSELFTNTLSEVHRESLPNLVNFSVTVLEYRNSAFLSLSESDLDQILLHTAMGECTLSVDLLIGQAKEFDMTTNTVRVTRELGTIHHVKVHETKKKLAVCLRLPSTRNRRLPGSRWVIYCVQDMRSLARLYRVIKTAQDRCKSMSPERPLHEIIYTIASEMNDSLPSPLSPPDSLLRSQSDSDSLPSHTYLDSIPNSLTDSLPLPSVTSPDRRGGVASGLARTSRHGSSDAVANPLPEDARERRSLTGSAEVGAVNTWAPPVLSGDNNSRDEISNSTELRSEEAENISTEGKKFSPTTALGISKESTPISTLSPQRENGSSTNPASLPVDAHPTRSKDNEGPAKKDNIKNLKLLEDTSGSMVGKKSSSKPSSKNSSRGGSGSNTPKAQRQANKKEGVNGASKIATATPPLAAPRKPPDTLPEDIKKKLEEISKELPSPMYGRQDSSNSDVGIESREGKSGAGEQIDGVRQDKGIYDRQDSSEAKENTVQEAVRASKQVSQRRSRRHPHRSSSKTIIAKPGLDSNCVTKFFRKIVAEDPAEVLMNLSWGVANFSSTPLCELEIGVMTSDRAMYVMEVLDPERHLSHPLSWSTENLPLGKVLRIIHTDIRRINIGIFDQSVFIEACCKGTMNKFVFFPHTQEKVNLFVENLKAAFDATGLQYSYASSKDTFVSSNGSKEEMVLRNPGAMDMASLKDDLVWSRSLVQVGNFIASHSKSDTSQLTISFESEMKRMSAALSAKFEIVQYVIVGEVTADVLPISQGGVHVSSRALILTNTAIYLCKEELDSWPHCTTAIRPPPFPRCVVLDSHPVSRVAGIRVCDKSHPIVSNSDPLYQFSISFKEMDDVNVSPLWMSEWKLCVHDRQYLDQLLDCLLHLSNEYHKDKPLVIKHIASKISSPSTPKMPSSHDPTDPRKMVSSLGESVSKKNHVNSARGSSPCFFTSIDLFEFATSSNYQRMKFFKKRVAQAEFLKSDEVPQSIFLAHCSSDLTEYVEIESCVIVSNYAVYLVSDVDNIERWLNSGGEFSYQRRDLLNRGDSNHMRCFYRLWLSDLRDVKIGLYYMSLAVTDTKNPEKPRFVIRTENPSATISFLNAAACVVDFHDKEEEKQMDDLLSQYDLMDDNPKEEEVKSKRSGKDSERHQVEFAYNADEGLGILKRAMVQESPGLTKGMSSATCNKAIKILYQQVVLLVEELCIRDHLSSSFYPHFVFLTNFGMYVCLNGSGGKKCSPAVMHPSDLKVKKWCHIDLLERVQVFSPGAKQYTCYNVVVHLRSSSRGSFSSSDSKMLSFLMQNTELLNTFLYHFSLMYRERCGKQISITWD